MTTQNDEHSIDDAELIAEAVLRWITHAVWTSTGGHAGGCAQCEPVGGEPWTFRQRVDAGHLTCAEEGARLAGARGVRANSDDVWIAVYRALQDPRLYLTRVAA